VAASGRRYAITQGSLFLFVRQRDAQIVRIHSRAWRPRLLQSDQVPLDVLFKHRRERRGPSLEIRYF
jgi:hypothetical protein